MTEIKSSHIKSVEHDGKNLVVEFQSGKKYCYTDVPKEHYDNMLKAESAGKYFSSAIKNNYKARLQEK